MRDKLAKLLKEVKAPKELALGYPVNRNNAFKIDLEQLGIKPDSFASTFMNNVGIPSARKTYKIDDIKELEEELINTLFTHLNTPQEEAFGYVTSGGTEANFAAVWWHREYLKNKFHQQPILIGSNKSHYSLEKIANQLQLELIKLGEDSVESDLETQLQKTTAPIIFWANIGSTVDGTIDNLQQINSILKKYRQDQYRVHGDGAIYGLLVPYLEKLKSVNSIFDLIDSLAISGHKFLGSYNVCGIIMARKSYIEQVFVDQNKKISYVRNAVDYTVSGSRPGLHIIELYLLLEQALTINESGKTKLEHLWIDCLTTADWFHKTLQNILGENHPLLHFNNSQLSVVLPAPTDDIQRLDISIKYSLMPVGEKQLGIYVLPRSTKDKLNLFLEDYKKCNSFYNK